jgi:Protein of unknown function (DUF1592)/Protein of unknown function (DUF1588)/Protein of unknown function (DUF1595)/Protein of unknown function (DUF1587)/Protein of unknown function (DUF1585)
MRRQSLHVECVLTFCGIAVGMLVACSDGSNELTGGGGSSSGGSSSGGSSSGGGDGGPGGDGGVPAPGSCQSGMPERRVWPLSRSEYDQSVKAVLGDTSNQAQTTFPSESRTNGFSANAQGVVVDSNLVSLMMTAAETIAAASVAGEMAFVSGTLACTLAAAPTSASPDPCAVSYITRRGAQFFRRPLEKAEVDDLYATYLVGVANPYPNTDAPTSGVEIVVTTLLQTPQFFYRTELGALADTTSSPVQLTPYEVASAISFLATGSPPDATLTAAAASGSLASPDQIAAQYQRLIATPEGHAQMEQFILEWLGGDQISKMGASASPLTPAVAGAMLTESQAYVEEAVFKGAGTVKELLTGGYTFANQELASFYGLPASGAGSSFGKVPLDPSSGRGGLLSQGAFLVSASKSGVPLLHRGRLIRNKVLCETLPSVASLGLPPGFVPPPFTPPPSGTTTRQALTQNVTGVCATCHQYFQPLGYGLEKFDAFGRHQDTQNGGAIDPSGQIVESTQIDPATGLIVAPASSTATPYADYPGLVSALAAQPRVAACFAAQVVSFASGRSGVPLDDCAVQDVQTPPAGSTTATIPQQFARYVTSKGFVWRTR